MSDIKKAILELIPEKLEQDFRSEEERQRTRIEKAFNKAFDRMRGVYEEDTPQFKEDEWL